MVNDPRDAAQGGIIDVAGEQPGQPGGLYYSVSYELDDGQTGTERIQAANANAAMVRVRDNLEDEGHEITSIEADVAPNQESSGSVANQYNPSGRGEFTGHWLIVDPRNVIIHRFGGVGNVQSDANRIAMAWLRQNPEHFQDGVSVVPELA